MGFTTGFTGGVTLTLSLAYLFVYTNQSNRIAQSIVIRSSTHTIESALAPSTARAPPQPSRLDTSATIRPSLVAELKEKWNAELLSAVHKLQNTDWSAVRDSLEESLLRLYHGEGYTGPEYSPEAWAEAAKSSALAVELEAAEKARASLAAAERKIQVTKNEVARSKKAVDEETSSLSSRLQGSYRAAREQITEKVHELEDRAHKAADSAKDKVHQWEDKAAHAYASAKAQVHMAEEKFERSADRKLLHMNDVEKALQQRYEPAGSSEKMQKSPEEVLEERYKPIDEENNGELKGI